MWLLIFPYHNKKNFWVAQSTFFLASGAMCILYNKNWLYISKHDSKLLKERLFWNNKQCFVWDKCLTMILKYPHVWVFKNKFWCYGCSNIDWDGEFFETVELFKTIMILTLWVNNYVNYLFLFFNTYNFFFRK